MLSHAPSILLVGCGNMGGAILNGWNDDRIQNISILNPVAIDTEHSQFTTPDQITTIFDIVLLAVKPQILDEVCASITHCVNDKTLIISIAAGKSIETIGTHFTSRQPIVRCMPNLPASIGEGVTVCVGNETVSEEQEATATDLLSHIGHVEWVKDESHMHAVTALSGSGPAYLFLLAEAMEQAGVKQGLSKDLSEKLARQTIIGSASLLKQDNRTASQLREAVTSKGGTTQAALNILMDNDVFSSLMSDAIKSAKQRSEEL